MGKVYREFSRQKYNKYKHQFPKMRESEIVSKIIKEWDALNNTAKDNLQKIYEKNKCLTLEDISSSEQLMKSELLKQEAQRSAKRSAEELQKSSSHQISATKIFPPPTAAKAAQSDSEYNRDSKSKDDSKLAESSSPKLVISKKKKIEKGPSTDYITFYRVRYNKLHSQHPRWTPKQISSIIRLEWKQEKGKKTRKLTRAGVRKAARILSGRIFFRKYRGLTAKQTIEKWKRFPQETRVYWINAAKGHVPQPKKETVKLNNTQLNSFRFINKKLAAA